MALEQPSVMTVRSLETLIKVSMGPIVEQKHYNIPFDRLKIKSYFLKERTIISHCDPKVT